MQVLFARNLNIEAHEIYDELSIEDVRNAADTLRPAYEESAGADGFVSIEPPPQLTGDTQETIKEGQRLWRTVNRPNLMIKVVATTEGIQAVEALIASVASFVVSRVDSQVDRALEVVGSPEALALRGKIAIANSK